MHAEIVDDSASPPSASIDDALSTASRCPTDEIVLSLNSDDKLSVAWGGIVQQKAGQPRDTDFGHCDSHWLVFVNAGTLRVAVDGKPVDVSQGHALLVLSHESCRGTRHDETATQWQWLTFRVARSRRRKKQIPVEVSRISRVDEPERISDLFRFIAEEFHEYRISGPDDPFLSTPGVHHMLMSLLARLDPTHPSKRPMSGASNVLSEKAKDYIRTNFTQAISTSDVARELECSPGYLGVAFRKAYGESPLSYVLGLRVGVAARFLRDTRMSISQVSQEVGFANLNYFSRVFRGRFGMTPSAYRKANSRLYVTTDI